MNANPEYILQSDPYFLTPNHPITMLERANFIKARLFDHFSGKQHASLDILVSK